MTYLDLILDFWHKDIEFNFSDKEIALYFYLLKVCNNTHWKNPFGLSNAITIARFGWGKTSFDTAKNNLKKAGLIDFRSGDGRGNVYQYSITGLRKKVNEKGTQKNTLSDTLSVHLSNTLSKRKPATSIDIDKDLEEDISEAKASGPAVASSKKNQKVNGQKNESPTHHWHALVAVWFNFYQKGPGNGEKPTFEGQAPASLKKIIERLKKRTEARQLPWDEQTACDTLLKFLTYAYGQDWLKDNFLLQNLERQYDKIANQHGTGNSNNTKGQQPISGISAFQKLSFINNGAGRGAAGNGGQDAPGKPVF